MQLSELLFADNVAIQCHNNPDADAIASGFALYCFFLSHGKNAKLFYSGTSRITKSNIKLMVDKLRIPLEFVPEDEIIDCDLLITCDCQFGQSNVSQFMAPKVAVIDHHICETECALKSVNSALGSCSTLVWDMMLSEGFSFDDKLMLTTALYYGLMTDTGNFAEIHHPLDRDCRDSLVYNKTLVNLFYHSNITLEELSVAGEALNNYHYDEERRYAVVMTKPCDPNILGLINDIVLQVDKIDVCIAFNELSDVYKLSVRSGTINVKANELASFLTTGIGSGGGHVDKAGGLILKRKLERTYPGVEIEEYLNAVLNEYFDSCMIIHANEYELDVSEMKKYVQIPVPIGYVDPKDFVGEGESVVVRTLEGDIEMNVDGDFYFLIGKRGEVTPINKDKFEASFGRLGERFIIRTEYEPTILKRGDGKHYSLLAHSMTAMPLGVEYIYAKELTETVKVFGLENKDEYMLGKPGDFIVRRAEDEHDIYIVKQAVFAENYSEM